MTLKKIVTRWCNLQISSGGRALKRISKSDISKNFKKVMEFGRTLLKINDWYKKYFFPGLASKLMRSCGNDFSFSHPRISII